MGKLNYLSVNPLLKVMNMVSILTVPLMMVFDKQVVDTVKGKAREIGFALPDQFNLTPINALWVIAVAVSAAALAWAIWQSKREGISMEQTEKV